ncbi:MAG: tetratricopeptide repeat protein [Terracidiphilus sp.]|jgi:tetratricopeptide (TPR) repeat protein
MIETVFVSGKDALAYFYEDEKWYSLSAEETIPVSASEVRRLVNGGGEYYLLRGLSKREISDALVKEKRRADALFLTLAVLDEQASISTRVLLAQQADDLLLESSNRDFVLKRILSWPLPTNVTAARHSLMQIANTFNHVAMVLKEVFNFQPDLHEVIARWRESAEEVGISQAGLSSLRSELVDAGFFRAVLMATVERNLHDLNSIIVTNLLGGNWSPQERALLLDFQRRIQSSMKRTREYEKPKPGRLFKRSPGADQNKPSEDPFRPDLPSNECASPQEARLNAFEAKQRVDKQINCIKEMLFRDRLPLAEKYVTDLMRFQLGRDDQEYAVMSLCNLTASALDANRLGFADELIKYAMELGPNDIVAFTARAEVLRRRGKFAAALAAFEEVISRFPARTYPLNGKANVLKEIGHFEQAAQLLRRVQSDFPEDSVAFNEEVGVLRSQGRHKAALQLAVANARRFPLDPVTRSVLAGSLSRVGRYAEASRHYQQALALDRTEVRFIVGAALNTHSAGASERALRYLEEFLKTSPTEVPLLQAKAQILRSIGQFSAAKGIYESILRGFPRFIPAVLGLRAVAVLEDPIVAAENKVTHDQLESELDWTGFRTYAVALVAADRPREAIQAIEAALPQCPWLGQRDRLKTTLGIAQMKNNEPTCIQTLQTNLESLEDRQRQARLLFLSHAQIEQNRQSIARVLLSRMVTTSDRGIQSIKEHLLRASAGKNTGIGKVDLSSGELELALAA